MASNGTPQFGDFNGDGLMDIAVFEQVAGQWNVCPSTGSALAACTAWDESRGWMIDLSTKTAAADFNGDGLTDLAYRQDSGWGVCASRGSSFQCWTNAVGPIVTSASGQFDLNGDGVADLVRHAGNGNWTVGIASAPKPDLLESVTNGLGAEIGINYKRLTDPAFYVRPTDFAYPVRGLVAPMYVVSATEQSNGLGGLRRVTYDYEGGRIHLKGRGFLSFAKQTVFDEATRIREVTQFRQDFPFIGMPTSVRTETETRRPISIQSSDYEKIALGAGTGTTYFPYLVRQVDQSYEIYPFESVLPVATTVTANTYGNDCWTTDPNVFGDGCGNLLSSVVSVYAGVESSDVPYTTATSNIYENTPPNWILGRLLRTEVTRGGPDQASQTRTSSFDYDPLTGLLSAETIEPSTPFELKTTYSRDDFGNITQTTVSGADIAVRTKVDGFDTAAPNFGRFNTRSTNPLGHVTSRTFDSGTGNVTSITDPNGLVTNYQYDELGRKAGETFNQHGINRSTTIERLWCSQTTFCSGSNEVFAVRSSDATGNEGYVLYDALERELRKIVKAPGGYVETLTEYDTAGRVARKSSPRFRNASATYWTSYAYDLKGRVLEERAPLDENTPEGRVTRFEHDGLVTRQFDALLRKTTKQVNPLGKAVLVTDALDGSIRYTYDAFENLISTQIGTDPATTMGYDIRGRKISMSDPNMGNWTYAYNALGELIEQTDGKLQTSRMAYDLLGRMRTRDEAEGLTTWVYDDAFIGALAEVIAPDYRRTYTYFPHGGVATESIGIISATPPPGSVGITSFEASPATFAEGGSTTLTWTTSEATACSASGSLPGWSGSKSANGSQTIRVNTAGNYTAQLSCTNSGGRTAVQTLSITVQASPPVAVDSFSATPATVEKGRPFTLAWNTRNAQVCSGSGPLPGWAGSKAVNGSQQLVVNSAGTYQATLTCMDVAERTASQTVSVSVILPPPAEVRSFTATPSVAQKGSSLALAWATANASSCTATGSLPGWSGTKALNGSQQLAANTAGSFYASINCTDSENRTVRRC